MRLFAVYDIYLVTVLGAEGWWRRAWKISEKWPALYTDSIIERKYNASQRDWAILYISRSQVTLAKNIYGSQESFPRRASWLVAAKVIKPWSNKVSWLLTRGILAGKCVLLHLFPTVTTPTPSYKLRPNWQELDLGYFDFGMVTGSEVFLAIFLISHKLFLESVIKLFCCNVRLDLTWSGSLVLFSRSSKY